MESAYFTALAGRPCYVLPREPLKPFGAIAHLLNTPTRRQVIVHHDPETTKKAATNLIASTLLNAGFDAGHDLVETFEGIIFTTLKWIQAEIDPIAALDAVLQRFDPENRVSPLEVHRTTVARMVPEMTRAKWTKSLGANTWSK